MLDLMYNLPSNRNIKKFVITAEIVERKKFDFKKIGKVVGI